MTSPLRLLLVDDSASLRALLKQILTEQDFQIVGEAATGTKALALMAQHRPQIVCLDIELPDFNGLDLLAEIRLKYPATEVVMITGDSQKSTVQQAIRAGARGYLVKPFKSQDVIQLLNKLSQYIQQKNQA